MSLPIHKVALIDRTDLEFLICRWFEEIRKAQEAHKCIVEFSPTNEYATTLADYLWDLMDQL